MSKKYVHYGDTEFKLDWFDPIANRICFNKPDGGLWASPCDSEYNWYEWCMANSFHIDHLKDYFIFTIKDDARVLIIKSHNDLVRLKHNGLCLDFSSRYPFSMNGFYPDFEKLLDLGYDAIEVYIQDTIYMDLYGWDCDSLLVLNPNCIVTNS
jgi:hypothetical protein